MPSAFSTRLASAMNESKSSNDFFLFSSSAVLRALTMGVSSFFIEGRSTMGADAARAGGTIRWGKARRAERAERTARPTGRARRRRVVRGPSPSPSSGLALANISSIWLSPPSSSSTGDARSRALMWAGDVSDAVAAAAAAPLRPAGAKDSTAAVEQHPISRTSLPPRLFMVLGVYRDCSEGVAVVDG